MFLEAVPERPRAEAMVERLADEILRHTALEAGAEGYVHPPYAFVPRPENLATRLYPDELMQRHLVALIKEQQVDGGWHITWPPVSPGSELEYRSIVTLNALKTLHAYRKF